MFVDPTGTGQSVVRGDHVSKVDALVTRVAPDRVFFQVEEDLGTGGKPEVTERVVELHAGENVGAVMRRLSKGAVMRRVSHFAVATMLALASVASAAENVVTKVTARADGGKTIIVVHGSATPSFTAYRLERPARVVVDVADGKLGGDDLRAGPDRRRHVGGRADRDGAVRQSDVSRTARVMIGFKRRRATTSRLSVTTS